MLILCYVIVFVIVCPENTYLIVNQVGSTYLSECLECPMNSMSEKGHSEICPCEEGFGRRERDNASLPCESKCYFLEAYKRMESLCKNKIPAVSS